MHTLFVFTTPYALTIWILLLGTAMLWRARWQRAGRWLVTIGLLSLALQSMTPVGGWLLGRLEFRHAMLDDSSPELPKQIVVLGGGVQPSHKLPLVSQLSPTSLERLVEGVRLYHQNPKRTLLLSGGGGERKPEARVMAELALQLGVPRDAVVAETETFNTGEQALMLAQRLANQPFILITSAAHMPRSLAAVEALGLSAVAAPVGHQTYRPDPGESGNRMFLLGAPHPDGPRFLQQVMYETVGHWRTQRQVRRNAPSQAPHPDAAIADD